MKIYLLLIILFLTSLISYADTNNIPLSIEATGSAKIEDSINEAKEKAINNAKENIIKEVISLFTINTETDKDTLNKIFTNFSYIKDFKVIENSERIEDSTIFISTTSNVYLNDIYKELSNNMKTEKPKIFITVNSSDMFNNNYDDTINNDIKNKFNAMGFDIVNKKDLNIENENKIKDILLKNNIQISLNVSSNSNIKTNSYELYQDCKTKSSNNDNSKIIAMINEDDNIEKRIDVDTNLSISLIDINKDKKIYSIENKGYATGSANKSNIEPICSSSVSNAIDNIFTKNIIEIKSKIFDNLTNNENNIIIILVYKTNEDYINTIKSFVNSNDNNLKNLNIEFLNNNCAKLSVKTTNNIKFYSKLLNDINTDDFYIEINSIKNNTINSKLIYK